MADEDRTLHVSVEFTLEEMHRELDKAIEVPPDYTDSDLWPFIREEMDIAVVTLFRNLSRAPRSGEFVHSQDTKLRIIQALIEFAPHAQTRGELAAKILQVIDLDNDALAALYGLDRPQE